jgi:uroporphyrinogen-III synthase
MIKAARPAGEILHVRGEHSVGDLSGSLRRAGLSARDVIGYRQILRRPTDALAEAFKGAIPLVFPLFSSRSALILGQSENAAPIHVVAISQNVSDAAIGLGVDTCFTAETPDRKSMLVTTCHRLKHLIDRVDRLEGQGETR